MARMDQKYTIFGKKNLWCIYRSIYIVFVLSSIPLLAQSAIFQPSNSNFYIYHSGAKQFIFNQGKITSWKLNTHFRKLSSGKRITMAADDAAGLAVAEKMTAIMKGLKQESMNLEDYRNYLRNLEGMIAQNHTIVRNIRGLVLRSYNGILSADDRAINQTGIDQYIEQIDMNAKFSQFNTKLIIKELTANSLGLDKVDVVRNLRNSMDIVDAALEKLMKRRVMAGTKENTMTFQIKGKAYYMVNIISSMSRISDLDMAAEILSFRKNNVIYKTQTGVLMMLKK